MDTKIEVVVGSAAPAPKTRRTFFNRVGNVARRIMQDFATWFNGPIDPDYVDPEQIKLISSEPCYVDVPVVFDVPFAQRTPAQLLESSN